MKESITHEKWLKKFSKTKEGRLFDLVHELLTIKNNPDQKLSNDGAATYLAAALSIATKGTKMEPDAIKIIELLVPQYYSE